MKRLGLLLFLAGCNLGDRVEITSDCSKWGISSPCCTEVRDFYHIVRAWPAAGDTTKGFSCLDE